MHTKLVQKIFLITVLLLGMWVIAGCGPVMPIPTATSTLIPIMTSTTLTEISSSIPTPRDGFTLSAPIPNSIYLVDYEGQSRLFLTSNNPGDSSSSDGKLIFEHEWKSASFLDLKAPRRLVTFTTDRVEGISPIIKGSDSQVIYFIVSMIESDHSSYELVYKVDLDTLKVTVIFEKGLAYSPSNDAKGGVLISQVKEPYMELAILPCGGCSPCPPYGVLIINMETGAKKFLGTVGNVEIDLNQNLVSYQMLTIDYACNETSICPCAEKETGTVLTESLPLTPMAALTIPSTPAAVLGATTTWTSPKDNMTMVYVSAGEFSMGSSGGFPDERPIHPVYLDAYWMDQTEVTNEMFAQFLNSEGNLVEDGSLWLDTSQANVHIHLSGYARVADSGYEDHPVVGVSWYGAQAYCKWRGDGTRLPTEAEWEKAASWDDARKDKRVYPWGNDISCLYANYYGCVNDTSKVGSYPLGASFYGLFDMAGNAAEWVADWYGWTYYADAPYNNPVGPSSSTSDSHVVRGGSWFHNDFIVYSSLRSWQYYETASPYIGFRCARDATP
ncbi:MAG: formylglycine-generating enzyme family protein [Chloroflexota bacterium]